jgi:hypothetical protein
MLPTRSIAGSRRTRRNNLDDDPEIAVTLEKNGCRRTVAIQRRGAIWCSVDSELARVAAHMTAAAALAAREKFDARLRTLLEDGWTPAP